MKSIKLAALLTAVCTLLFAAGSPAQAGQGSYAREDARLVIRYSPVLGLNAALRVFINERGAGGITKGHTYVAYLPPGRHTIRVSRNGRLYESSVRRLNVRPGQTYAFVAKYLVNEMIIVPAEQFHQVMSPQF